MLGAWLPWPPRAVAQEGQVVHLSKIQVDALSFALKKANHDGEKIESCEMVIDETGEKIKVSFIEKSKNPYSVGTDSKYCNFTYILSLNGKKIERKYYHR